MDRLRQVEAWKVGAYQELRYLFQTFLGGGFSEEILHITRPGEGKFSETEDRRVWNKRLSENSSGRSF